MTTLLPSRDKPEIAAFGVDNPPDFYNRLSPERHKLFHGFLFDPPEQRWG